MSEAVRYRRLRDGSLEVRRPDPNASKCFQLVKMFIASPVGFKGNLSLEIFVLFPGDLSNWRNECGSG